MLADAQAAAQRGQDVVLAYFEPHARPDTIAQAQALEVLPHKKIEYRGKPFDEMDTDAVLRRNPKIALVDELAHTNIPGSARARRWEDVQVLLAAGIEVWTTVNVQHIESLNDQIWQITGIQMRETVPDWVTRQAAETLRGSVSVILLIEDTAVSDRFSARNRALPPFALIFAQSDAAREVRQFILTISPGRQRHVFINFQKLWKTAVNWATSATRLRELRLPRTTKRSSASSLLKK